MKTFTKKLKKIWWRVKSFLAICYYGNPSKRLKVVGVTGTNGKTTTATLLYKIATELGYKAGLLSTVENMVGREAKGATHTTPDSVSMTRLFKEMRDHGCEYVFMEVSSHALDQNRVWGVNFVGGIFTNLTHDHLDYHKSLESYFQAKKKFFSLLPEQAFALSNADDQYGRKILEGTKAKKYTYGLREQADFRFVPETKLIGNFNKYNALAVYSALMLLGFDESRVKEAFKTVEPPRGRFEYIKSSAGVLSIVDYAHTPDALENVLTTIQEMKIEGRVISVFGCGGDRDPAKRPVMGGIGAKYSDVAIFTSDNPRSEDPEKIIEEMKAGLSSEELKNVKTIPNRREAIIEAVKLAQKGDIILCAGKGHETYQEVRGVKRHFDDLEELQKAFRA